MEIEVEQKVTVNITGYDQSVTGFFGEDGEIYVSGYTLVKVLGELAFNRARQVCRHHSVCDLFDQVYIQEAELDVINIKNFEHCSRLFDNIERYRSKWLREKKASNTDGSINRDAAVQAMLGIIKELREKYEVWEATENV